MIRVGLNIVSPFGELKIKKIELCEKWGQKEGIPMKEVFEVDKDRCVFDLEDNRWAYGYQCVVSDSIYNKLLDNGEI